MEHAYAVFKLAALLAPTLVGSGLIVRATLPIRWVPLQLLGTAFLAWGLLVSIPAWCSLIPVVQLNYLFGLLTSCMVLLLGLMCSYVRQPRLRLPTASVRDPWEVRVGVTAISWTTVCLALSYLLRAVLEPVYIASDAPIYHLPFALRWWQDGKLSLVPTPFGDSAAAYFPANGSVWLLWLLLPGEGELFAKAAQWPFLALGAVAVYALARLAHARRAGAQAAACVWSLSPLVLFYSHIPLADLIMGATYLSALAFYLAWRRFRSVPCLIYLAWCLGCALGTKYVSVLFALPLLVLMAREFFIGAWRPWWPSTSGRNLRQPTVATWALCGLALLLPSSYWYARNGWLAGNPIYPAHVQFGSWVLWPGWYSIETLKRTSIYHLPEERIDLLCETLWRFSTPLLAPFYLVGALSTLLHRRPIPRFLLVVALLNIALFWYVNPYQTQERFLIGTSGILAALLGEWFSRHRIGLVLAALAAVAQPFGHQPPLFRSLDSLVQSIVDGSASLNRDAVGLWKAAAWLRASSETSPFRGFPPLLGVWTASGKLPNGWAMAASVGTAWAVSVVLQKLRSPLTRAGWLGFTALAAVLATSWPTLRFAISEPAWARFYPVWELTHGWLQLEQYTSGSSGIRIAYAGTNLPYYLYSSRLRNVVRYVNINRQRHFLMHDYHRWYRERGEPLARSATPDWDRRERDEQAWIDNLRALNIDFLFVAITNVAGGRHNVYDPEGFPIERTWADSHPETFELLFAHPRCRLYRLKKPPQNPPRIRPQVGRLRQGRESSSFIDATSPR